MCQKFEKTIELLAVLAAILHFVSCEINYINHQQLYDIIGQQQYVDSEQLPLLIRNRRCESYSSSTFNLKSSSSALYSHSSEGNVANEDEQTCRASSSSPNTGSSFDVGISSSSSTRYNLDARQQPSSGPTVTSSEGENHQKLNPKSEFSSNSDSVRSDTHFGTKSSEIVSGASVTQVHNDDNLMAHRPPPTSFNPTYNTNVNWRRSSVDDGASSVKIDSSQESNTLSVTGSENNKDKLTVSGQTRNGDFKRAGLGLTTGTINLRNIDKKDGISASMSGTNIPGQSSIGAVSINLPSSSTKSEIHDGQVTWMFKRDLDEVGGCGSAKPKNSAKLGVQGSF